MFHACAECVNLWFQVEMPSENYPHDARNQLQFKFALTDLSCLIQQSMEDFQAAHTSLNVASSFLPRVLASASTTSKSISVQSKALLRVRVSPRGGQATPCSMAGGGAGDVDVTSKQCYVHMLGKELRPCAKLYDSQWQSALRV